MKHAALSLILSLLLLVACAESPTLMPQPNAPQASPSATPDAFELVLGQVQAQGTLQSLDMTRIFLEAEITATYIAPTLRAADTGTAQAWQEVSWTVEANATNTKVANNMTEIASLWTPTPDYTAIVGAAAASAQQTALHGQAVSIELAIERERMMNEVQAIVPWAALVTVLVFSLALAWRWARVRPIQRGISGDAPLLVIDGTIYDADRNPLPAMQMNNGQPTIPMLTPPELQGPTTARDQAIDLARSLPTKNSRQHLPRAMFANNQPAFQVVSPGKLPPLLKADPEVTQILDAEWRLDDNE